MCIGTINGQLPHIALEAEVQMLPTVTLKGQHRFAATLRKGRKSIQQA